MHLILKKDRFNNENIIFRYKKNTIKFSYKIQNINLLGLSFMINNFKIVYHEYDFYYLKLSEKDSIFFNNLNSNLSNKIVNYTDFIINNTIKVKNDKETINPERSLLLNFSNMKNKEGSYITHIYVI